jgi:hypothetical protein
MFTAMLRRPVLWLITKGPGAVLGAANVHTHTHTLTYSLTHILIHIQAPKDIYRIQNLCVQNISEPLA